MGKDRTAHDGIERISRTDPRAAPESTSAYPAPAPPAGDRGIDRVVGAADGEFEGVGIGKALDGDSLLQLGEVVAGAGDGRGHAADLLGGEVAGVHAAQASSRRGDGQRLS